MTNVLKKLSVNPLGLFHLRDEVNVYENIQSDQEMADFYHMVLSKFSDRPLVVSFIYAMIGYSTEMNPETLINQLYPMKIEITSHQGRWLVNGKRIEDLSYAEKEFMNDFFREVKINGSHDEQV